MRTKLINLFQVSTNLLIDFFLVFVVVGHRTIDLSQSEVGMLKVDLLRARPIYDFVQDDFGNLDLRPSNPRHARGRQVQFVS